MGKAYKCDVTGATVDGDGEQRYELAIPISEKFKAHVRIFHRAGSRFVNSTVSPEVEAKIKAALEAALGEKKKA